MIFQSNSSFTNVFHILIGAYILYMAFVTNPNGIVLTADQLKIIGGVIVAIHVILLLQKEFTQFVVIQQPSE